MTAMASSTRPPRALAAVPRPCAALQVCSIDDVFVSAMQSGSFDARVHSVFDRVINLERTSGGLFTLAARGMDNAPLTAIVGLPGVGAAGIAVGDPVVAIDGGLRVGDGFVLHFATASIWRAWLPSYPPAPERLAGQLRAARSILARQGVHGGMAVQAGAAGGFALEVATALEQRSKRLIEALAQARHADACRHAVSMLGLGPGLTPSGDDFLVGLFAILNVADSPCQGWLDGGAQVLLQAEHATNAISLAALTAAAGGRVRESIAALIGSLLHGTPATLVQPLSRVLAIGATSGADLVAGILAGLELNLQVEATRSAESALPRCVSTQRHGVPHDAAASTPIATGATC
ncbi:MAG: DUF2877 domain-containing protein [Pseudomonadota bacterium]|nr:DUF2877 domain-containing protein [Pseudomonadota bacterium]